MYKQSTDILEEYFKSIIKAKMRSEKEIQQIDDEMIKILKPIIENNIQKNTALNCMKEVSSENYIEIAHHIFSLILAAYINTFKITSWFLVEILQNEDVLKDVIWDIEHTFKIPIKNINNITYDNIQNLSFIKNCIYETIRLHNSGNSYRKVKKDLIINGFDIPKVI